MVFLGGNGAEVSLVGKAHGADIVLLEEASVRD